MNSSPTGTVHSPFNAFLPFMLKDCRSITSLMKTEGLPRFDQSTLSDLCQTSVSLLKQCSSLQRIDNNSGSVVVVGDIHGSIIDLFRIFAVYGIPPEQRYIFLGDYVDRGEFSVEVLTILLSIFCTYPEHIILLRGNHEFRSVCNTYGFRDEVLNSYTPDLFNDFIEVFSYLPLAAVVNNSIFCVHGGISARINDLSDIENLQRPIDDISNKLVEDLVWSDPSKFGACGFIPSSRHHGCIFGSTAVNNFYENTGITAIIRGHSFVKEGVDAYSHISLLSVFSSSSYERQNNLCGIIYIDEYSNMTPELLEAATKIFRKETKFSKESVQITGLKKTNSIPKLFTEFTAPIKTTILQKTNQQVGPKKRSLPNIKFHF